MSVHVRTCKTCGRLFQEHLGVCPCCAPKMDRPKPMQCPSCKHWVLYFPCSECGHEEHVVFFEPWELAINEAIRAGKIDPTMPEVASMIARLRGTHRFHLASEDRNAPSGAGPLACAGAPGPTDLQAKRGDVDSLNLRERSGRSVRFARIGLVLALVIAVGAMISLALVLSK